MEKTKYALLDTDFISKTHLIRKDDDNKLIDRIMQLPNYEFYCHMQVKTELFQHNVIEAPKLLDNQIECGKITCYDDRDILCKLAEIFSSGAVAVYRQMLMIACEAYGYGYFAKQFPKIAMLNCEDISLDSFLLLLIQECETLALDRNLGEIKSFLLLQFLNLTFGEQIYVFCSDDRNARNGVISICEARCVSVLSSFLRLKKKSNLKEQMHKSIFAHTFIF